MYHNLYLTPSELSCPLRQKVSRDVITGALVTIFYAVYLLLSYYVPCSRSKVLKFEFRKGSIIVSYKVQSSKIVF